MLQRNKTRTETKMKPKRQKKKEKGGALKEKKNKIGGSPVRGKKKGGGGGLGSRRVQQGVCKRPAGNCNSALRDVGFQGRATAARNRPAAGPTLYTPAAQRSLP